MPAQPHTGSIQDQIREVYRDYNEAVRRMDSAKYMSFFAPDFQMISPDGKVHLAAEMKEYQRVNAATTKKVNAYTNDIEAITPLSDTDVAVIVLQKYDRNQAPMDKPDEPHNIRTSVVQRETWHKGPQGWRLRKTEEILTGPVFFDGKIQQQ